MPKIKKLPLHEARKIAAGEVVDRPANVFKELVENSIDACANNITIFIEDAGKKLIRVVDDGCGMSKEDALLCFEHHATSKINSIDDLNTISTFGFRGEALSSISSVSNVTLITKEKSENEGICLTFENNIAIQRSIACSNGTDISISNIFYNVPARLKFLKKSETEWRQIVLLFQSFCLSYPNIHFKLFNDGNEIYNCPVVSDINFRIVQLWDHNLSKSMISFDLKDANLKINGLISNHQFFRFNRSQIFFFVNNRLVKNQNILKALLKGYLNVLPNGKFPAAVIFINIDPTDIDVNIHPRKEEVQFLNPKKVENILTSAVKKNLEQNLSKQINKEINFLNQKDSSIFLGATATTFDFEQLPSFEPIDSFNSEIIQNRNFASEQFINENILNNTNVQEPIIFNNFFEDEQKIATNIIGQYKKTYILLDNGDEGLLFIDQHAAHERVLYELFSKKFSDVATVNLIFPVIIKLTELDLNILMPHLELLNNNGIKTEIFSRDQLIIHSTPVHIKDIQLNDFIQQIIFWIEEHKYLDKIDFFKMINEKIHAQMACKAAIKAGDILQQDQIVQLIKDLQKVNNRFTCPHGRPTSWIFSLYEIEKKFKRKI